MKEQNLNIRYMVVQLSELSQQEQELVNRAKAATSNAYANYSHFYVGAALLLGDGRIVIGANQENAAFPSGTCAERTTIYYAHSKYPESKFQKLAIAASKDGKFTARPISPCGACRQAILEYETLGGEPVKLLLYGTDCIYIVNSISDLLPLCFSEF